MSERLTKAQVREVLDAYPGRFKHTQACRTKPGNVKGDGGHPPSVTTREDGTIKVDLGGYRCACDWWERVAVAYAKLKARDEASIQELADCDICPTCHVNPAGSDYCAEDKLIQEAKEDPDTPITCPCCDDCRKLCGEMAVDSPGPDATCASCNQQAPMVFLEDVQEYGWSCSTCNRSWTAS